MKKILISLIVLVIMFGITVSAMENNNTEPRQEQGPQISDSRRMDEINAELKKVKMQLKHFQIWMTGKIKSLKS